MFRPSDDATVFSFLIPSNIFAAEVLDNLSEMSLKIFKDETFAVKTKSLSTSLFKIINDYAIVNHPKYGEIYAYEINGFGSYNLMDDANVPNLLSIPYLTNKLDKQIVQNTRNFVLSTDNPFYFEGSVAQGTGGPHVGLDMIWPLGIIMRGITSQNEKEIREVLKMLQESTAGTGFMHESFHKNDVKHYTRSWFAWANTLFGEFILKLYKEHPELLN
jgi:meiotically up-regulated gene 157 (Mug157) protein